MKTDSGTEPILHELLTGNRRFASGAGVHPRQNPSRRADTVLSQHPFAAIVGCADSRVPPEILFDCGIGDLFVIRLAGNVVNDSSLATLQFAVGYVGIRLIIVLGHRDCAAVKSVLDGIQAGEPLDSYLLSIEPAVAAAKRASDSLEDAILENVRLSVRRLEAFSWETKPDVRGACYDLKTGLVTLV